MNRYETLATHVAGFLTATAGFLLALKETIAYIYYYQHSHIYVHHQVMDNPNVSTSKYTLLCAGVGAAMVIYGAVLMSRK